jgi:RNA polymerase sigma-B factor
MSRYPGELPPSEQDEVSLAVAARGGDREALEALVDRYAPLVRRIANRFNSPGHAELDDLIQVGLLGLLEALSRFKPERGSFGGYAAATISGTIKRHLRDRGWRVRLPRSLHDAAIAVDGSLPGLRATLGREPTDAELSEETGLTDDQIREVRSMQFAANPLSLEAPIDGEDAMALAEAVGDEDPGMGRAETRAQLDRYCDGLDDRERRIVTLRFGLDLTQVEIAERVGVSQMHVSRLLRRAVERMRHEAEGEGEPVPADAA